MARTGEMWTNRPIVGFDTETTGVDPFSDRLVTASVIVVDANGIEKSYWLADPGIEIPLKAQQVHGITTEKARREGQPARTVLDEVAQLLHRHMAQNHPIVAFNASFDLTLMENELARHELPTLAERLGHPVAPIVDPLMLDKTMDKYRKGRRNLETMAKFYQVWDADNFHNAEADVLVTLKVLGALLRKYPQVAQQDLAELMAAQSATHAETEAWFAKKARERGESSPAHTGWPVAR